MTDMKIVLFHRLNPAAVQAIVDQKLPGMSLTVAPLTMPDDGKIPLVAQADFIMVIPPILSDRVLQAAKKCKLVQCLSSGYDTINLHLAAKLGVPVANNGGANSASVAEHAMMLVLACYRRLTYHANNVRAGQWKDPQDPRTVTGGLEGKTFGILGMGSIGRRVATRARAFDVTVQYYSRRRLSDSDERSLGVRGVSLEELLRTSDVVSLHVPLTPQTRGIIGQAQLALMKPSAIIINTCRAGVIDEAALVEALRTGRIAGAGLDVIANEPPRPDDPLLQLDNVIITPHLSGSSREAFANVATIGFENIQRVWNGEPPQYVVETLQD